jgi:hypothetical protein
MIHGWSCSSFVLVMLAAPAGTVNRGGRRRGDPCRVRPEHFQQMAAAECQGIATDTAYAECERRLSQQLATSASATS